MGSHGVLSGSGRPRLAKSGTGAQRFEGGIDEGIVAPRLALADLPQHGRGGDTVPSGQFAQGRATGSVVEVMPDGNRQPGWQVMGQGGERRVMHGKSFFTRPLYRKTYTQPKRVLVTKVLTGPRNPENCPQCVNKNLHHRAPDSVRTQRRPCRG